MNYFIHDERDLSPAYLASCRKFLDEFIEKRIRENMGLKPGEVDDGSSNKPQAASATKQTQLKSIIKTSLYHLNLKVKINHIQRSW